MVYEFQWSMTKLWQLYEGQTQHKTYFYLGYYNHRLTGAPATTGCHLFSCGCHLFSSPQLMLAVYTTVLVLVWYHGTSTIAETNLGLEVHRSAPDLHHNGGCIHWGCLRGYTLRKTSEGTGLQSEGPTCVHESLRVQCIGRYCQQSKTTITL